MTDDQSKVLLPHITPPKNQQLSIKPDLRYIISQNHAQNLIIFFFLALFCGFSSLAISIFVLKETSLLVFFVGIIATIIGLLYWPVTILSTKQSSLSLTTEGLVSTSLFSKKVYPYSAINRIIFAKKMEYFSGRATQLNSGASLLLLDTEGKIPGFPAVRLAHISRYKMEDLELFFNAFEEKDRVSFQEKLTPTDIIAWTTGVLKIPRTK